MSTPLPGFKLADGQPKPRLIVSVEALDKCGKSNFAFTAPGPLAYFPFDVGEEGVIEKFQDEKQIYVPVKPYETRFEGGAQKQEATTELLRFEKDYKNALRTVRSVVVDTAGETWELLRLARLGKLTQVKPHHYTEVNQEYRDFVREAYDSDANLILLHKLKAVWVDGKDAQGNAKSSKNGEYERAGFSETGYLVQVNVRMWREEDREEGDLGFRMKILNCRQNPEIAGMVLANEQINFPMLGMLAMPNVDPANWE